MGRAEVGTGDMGITVQVREAIPGIIGHICFIFRNIDTGEERVSKYDNLIVTVAKNMIARRLAGEANACNITYIAVGTGAGVPAIGDTTLSTELDRNPLTTISASGVTVSFTGFFGASEANGTLTNMGLFGEGASATPDSGVLINHAAVSEVKSTSETMTITGTLTIN